LRWATEFRDDSGMNDDGFTVLPGGARAFRAGGLPPGGTRRRARPGRASGARFPPAPAYLNRLSGLHFSLAQAASGA